MSRHGTRSCYNAGCRQAECIAANRAYHKQRRRQARERRELTVDFSSYASVDRYIAPVPPKQHGRLGTYMNHACRCAPCTEAARLYMAQRRAEAAA